MSRFVKLLARWCGLAALALASATAAAQTPQTITFASISTKTYGSAPFAVSATASSGLAVVVTSNTTGVCTVSGSTVTLVAAGSCTLAANQPGDGIYAPAPEVQRSFTVNKASQSITFASISTKTLLNSPQALTATASSGLPVDLASTTPAVCTVSGATATLLATGTCSITANQAGNANYNAATQITRSFSVTKASQTITFASISNRTWSATPFTITGTASSGLPVAFATTTPTICEVATDGGGITRVTMLIAGVCTVTANQAGDATYNAATQVSRSFTINKAGQTLTIGTIATKNVGDADFQPEVTNSAGLAYTLGTTTGAVCTVASNAVTIVTTGTCTIQANAPATPTHNAATQQSRNITIAAARAPVVYYVHPDQIGTPRVMTRASDNAVVWRWDNEEAFGDNEPNERPSGSGERFKYDLRFTGQVRDAETNTNYNYFRDYSPPYGGYNQSDPIGLNGGINTYMFSGANPISGKDEHGLAPPGTWQTILRGVSAPPIPHGDFIQVGYTGPTLGASVTLDKNLNLYFGVQTGNVTPFVSYQACVGNVLGPNMTEAQLSGFIQGAGGQVSFGQLGVGAGMAMSGGRKALLITIGSPQLPGSNAGYTWRILGDGGRRVDDNAGR